MFWKREQILILREGLGSSVLILVDLGSIPDDLLLGEVSVVMAVVSVGDTGVTGRDLECSKYRIMRGEVL